MADDAVHGGARRRGNAGCADFWATPRSVVDCGGNDDFCCTIGVDFAARRNTVLAIARWLIDGDADSAPAPLGEQNIGTLVARLCTAGSLATRGCNWNQRWQRVVAGAAMLVDDEVISKRKKK